MYQGMHQIGDTIQLWSSLEEHISDLIAMRRNERDPKIIDEINEELTRCYEAKYANL